MFLNIVKANAQTNVLILAAGLDVSLETSKPVLNLKFYSVSK